jgi:hypothetical protein
MSQVGLWNTTLTADEVSSLYNHGLPIDLTTDQAAYESSSNLVGYWRMGSGTLDTYPLIADQKNATLGSELLSQPVDLQTDFVNNSGGVIVDADTFTSAGGTLDGLVSSTNTFEIGKTYKLIISGNTTSSGFGLYPAGGSGFYGSGFGTYYFTATHEKLWVRQQTAGTTNITSFSIKQVNGNPAIMTNQTSSDIENGSPYANIVQDSDFTLTGTQAQSTTGTYWTTGTGWTIANGLATQSSGNGQLSQTGILIADKTYSVTVVIDSINVGGELNVVLGSQSTTLTFTESGTKTGVAKANEILYLLGNATFSGSISSITVTEVNTGLQGYWKMGDGTNDEYPVIYDQTNPDLGSEVVLNSNFSSEINWDKDASWTIANNKANNNGSSGDIFQELTLEVGKNYVVRAVIDASSESSLSNTAFQIRKNSGGSSWVQLLSGLGQIAAGTVNYLYLTFNASETNSLLRVYSEDNISFYNPTIKEYFGNPATMTNMVEGNITNQYPLTKIRNYYRMGDGILDGYPIIQDQTSPNLAHIPTTNLFLQSEDFTSEWSTSDATITANSTISPDGTQNASTLTTTASGGTVQETLSISDGNVAFSLFVKKGSTNGVRLRIDAATDFNGYFDLTDGTIYSTTGNAKIEPLANDWYRISISASITSFVKASVYTTDGTTSYDNGTVFIWGAQIEQQSQATAYIKSDGIAAVRKSSTTNLIEYSEDFSEWSTTGTTSVSSNDNISPDGTQNASTVSGLTGSGSNDLYLIVGGNPASKTYSFSVYLKGSGTLRLQMSNNVDQGINEIVTLTSDWKRHIVTGTFNSTSGTLSATLDDSGATATQYKIWGAQLEEQTQAEIYAPTKGLPVTIDLFTENNYGTMTNMSPSDIVEDTPNN